MRALKPWRRAYRSFLQTSTAYSTMLLTEKRVMPFRRTTSTVLLPLWKNLRMTPLCGRVCVKIVLMPSNLSNFPTHSMLCGIYTKRFLLRRICYEIHFQGHNVIVYKGKKEALFHLGKGSQSSVVVSLYIYFYQSRLQCKFRVGSFVFLMRLLPVSLFFSGAICCMSGLGFLFFGMCWIVWTGNIARVETQFIIRRRIS